MLFALVHGTTQGPDGWNLLAQRLMDAGHDVHALDLVDIDPSSTSAEYGELAAAQLPGGGADLVVAHSGSGLLLSSIASAVHAKVQVFLGAYIPNGSSSLLDELAAQTTPMFHDDWIGIDPVTDHQAARHFLFHDCDTDTANWAITTLRSFIPTAVYSEAVPLAPTIRSIVIVPENDRTLRADWMKTAAHERLGVDAIVVPGGHCPHVSQPAQVANILTESP